MKRRLTEEDAQMSNKHLRRWSASPAIREVQVNSSVRYRCTFISIAYIKVTAPNAGKHTQEMSHSFIADGNVKFPLWKKIWQFLIEINMQLPNDPAIAPLDIYSREIKTCVHTKTCT